MLDILWTVLLVFDGIPIFDALGVAITTMGSCGPSFRPVWGDVHLCGYALVQQGRRVPVHAHGKAGNFSRPGPVDAVVLEAPRLVGLPPCGQQRISTKGCLWIYMSYAGFRKNFIYPGTDYAHPAGHRFLVRRRAPCPLS